MMYYVVVQVNVFRHVSVNNSRVSDVSASSRRTCRRLWGGL